MLRGQKHPADLGYAEITAQLQELASTYDCQLISIGKSVLGLDLWTIRLGTGSRSVYLTGAHHACEWLTATLLVRFCRAYLAANRSDAELSGVRISDLFHRTAVWVTPIVNPDGVSLARDNLRAIPAHLQADLIKWNGGRTDFSTWKANIRGVDLNRQYRAEWHQAYRRGPKAPAPKYYAGRFPESEPESRAVAKFIRTLEPALLVCYHSQGEVIYWDYRREAPAEARRIARELSRLSGYALVAANPQSAGSGGLKDWFIHEFRRPGFTIEVGRGINPLPPAAFDSIWRQNLPLLARLPAFVLT